MSPAKGTISHEPPAQALLQETRWHTKAGFIDPGAALGHAVPCSSWGESQCLT